MKHVSITLTVLLFAACSDPVDTTESLITAMNHEYSDGYFRTLTFTQKTVNTLPDGSKREEIWYESMKVPGMLSIRFDPVDSGRGVIFRNDSLHVMDQGKPMLTRPLIHPLLVLGFDVHFSPVGETMRKLADLGYDLSVMHESTWRDRPVYVVGAGAGDDSSKQFWVDKKRLVFLRSMEINPNNGVRMEVQFNKYERVDGGWVAPEVLFLRDGKVLTEEYYSDLRTNVGIDEREFDPEGWMYAAGN
jgi:hypothetical protein